MPKLTMLRPRVIIIDIRSRPTQGQPGKPWAKSPDAPLRLRGRALQERNNRIKLRDLYTCRACGIVTTELQVDHIQPLARSGPDTDDNCQALCLPCHDAKTRRENAER